MTLAARLLFLNFPSTLPNMSISLGAPYTYAEGPSWHTSRSATSDCDRYNRLIAFLHTNRLGT